VNRHLVIALLILSSSLSFSQSKGDLIIGIQVDLIKTNNSGYFQRFQTGAEGNYFLHKKFSATGGIEYWSGNRQLSLTTGARWYPMEDAFIRFRGLLGANDFAVGGGWSMPVKENLRFEALSDFYFAGHITIRVGFTYWIMNTSSEKK
jgi:hypothetical protein